MDNISIIIDISLIITLLILILAIGIYAMCTSVYFTFGWFIGLTTSTLVVSLVIVGIISLFTD